ncbi:hypothetical protein RIF29_29507 [Crotalaria pallida]|uniref:Uncharacterized protein n=1 Tax=Crotalaria pallida TaxID=3830 RepID=A0AAN9HTZ4_CROPI
MPITSLLRNSGLICVENVMASPNGEDSSMTSPNGEDPPITKKRTFGLTAMNKVEWNVKGQPKNKKGGNTLVTYIGVIVRQMVPITYCNWNDKSLAGLKDIIWQDIISAFDVEEKHKAYTQFAGKSHRQFRTKAGKFVRDANGNINLKPPKKYANIIREDDWTTFVKKRTEDKSFLDAQSAINNLTDI